jgi:hypothetical protein
VCKHTDLTGDLDEFAAIKQIAEIEIDLFNSWLHQLTESQQGTVDQEKLLELRYLCVLRNRLLANIEADFLATGSSSERPNSGAVSSGPAEFRITWTG